MTFDNIFRKSITKVQSLRDKGNSVKIKMAQGIQKKSNTFGLQTNPRVSKAQCKFIIKFEFYLK